MEKPGMIKPALIGGAILGLLSAVPILNLLCCGWALVGGAIAARVYIKDSPLPITSGNGAALGALSGFVGSVFFTIVATIRLVVAGIDSESIAEKLRVIPTLDATAIKLISENFVLFFIISSIVSILLTIGICALGGVIGVALFEKRKDGMPPPPPPYPYPYPPPPPPVTPQDPPQSPPQDLPQGPPHV